MHLLPSPQQILVFVVERGVAVLPWVVAAAGVGCLLAWRRRRRLVRLAAGGLSLLIALLATIALLFALDVRSELRERTLGQHFQIEAGGGTHTVGDWPGRVVVVNYWATWCQPCRREIPALTRLAEAYRTTAVVVMLTDEDPAVVEKWEGGSFGESVVGFFADPAPRAGLASVILGWRPVTLVLDRRGGVRDVMLGARTYGELAAAVAAAS